MTINIRVPYWVNGEVKVVVNKKKEYSKADSGYISIRGNWKKGDVIDITLPMNINIYTSNEGYFSYEMTVEPNNEVYLVVTY